MQPRPIQIFALGISVCLLPAGLAAQDQDQPHTRDQPPEQHHRTAAPDRPAPDGWSWTADGNAFVGYNYQQRKFADFWAWESQNWGMVSAERQVGPGRLAVQGMLTLEPWTVGTLVYAKLDGLFGGQRVVAGGSPQVYQTGESFQRAPIINYQHPHDLLMALGATYRFAGGPATYTLGAHLVGSPTLGPTAFMHRESARNNPQAPLTHHYLDSTHITPGVVTAGVEAGQMRFETSAFRGAEPDENRTNIEQPRLDSWSARAGWRRGPWSAQFSGGRLHEPEWFEPVDVNRFTASIVYDGTLASRPLAAMIAWGQNREPALNISLDGYLAEWDLELTRSNTIYGRAESVLKEIFGLGVHPRGLLNHPRNFSQINALTLGYVHDLAVVNWSRIGIGADLTGYRTSTDLVEYFGSPLSFHAFVRWRPSHVSAAHVH